ncbi:hypothetical protein DPMN_186071 [Dreissena polymorpha]|uniref:CCHC-type domain-containing protein n=1 Tax=Dreissena polymorpha TaxID=45954 RepID=A0A9D4I7V7_DREPO|nr:hypothetical protein DPMN_186071 [Dreissena polymorpha]
MQSQFNKQMALNRSEGADGKVIGGLNQMNNTPNRCGYGRSGGFQPWNNNQNQAGYSKGGGYSGRRLGGRPTGRGERNNGLGAQQETALRQPGINDCFVCGETGHIRADCEKWRATQQCYACQEMGDRRPECPYRLSLGPAPRGLNERGS